MWKQFGEINKIDTNIINVIENELKFDKITKVQNVVIPHFLKNKDVIVKACTGSGKTLAFLIPMFHKLINYAKENTDYKNKILSVIMLPSRELSIQVFNIFLKFIANFPENLKFSFALLIGGKKIQKDLDKLSLEIPNIIIATPGRFYDLDDKLKLTYKDLQILILDEADKMLELGYESKVTSLLEKFPKQRRTGLFSATVNSQIENLIKVGMRNPVFIDVKVNLDNVKITMDSVTNLNEEIFYSENYEAKYFDVVDIDSNKSFLDKKDEISKFTQEIPKQLMQYYISLESIKSKLPLMINMIKKRMYSSKKMMIFFATCNAVDYYSIVLPKYFEKEGIFINFFKLHSKITQKKRKGEYKKFVASDSGILLTTDLSARGIDVPNVDLILQFDPPKNEEVYIHRVGRTARVGSAGDSILFLTKTEETFIKYMKEKKIIINPYANDDVVLDDDKVFEDFKEINISDKWIYDKAAKSFVSYIRFYTEHDLKYIFDVKLLDIGNLANCLCLLRLPRIKEILGKKVENFIQDDRVNPKELAYVNSNTAKQMEIKEEYIKFNC
jgi:ATP-dependent RNA helicase DDX55/SPB4